ncbi:family 43 glycosylhydrolase [Streptomyces griseoviridis]|uniref:family 43 glycosylhydrolase n=1 Tax=Streptomyces griseoviridis TaxID=45398 RepID=UPI0034547CFB
MTMLHNPVIRGFAPDPSLVRVGDWYYVATSSFEWFPTIPLHRSRDLLNWEYAGHVGGAVPSDSLGGVPDSGGVWAPSLSWDGERFWVVYGVVRSLETPYFDVDVYVSTAMEVGGEWRAPRRVASHGFDPALFHHEGRLWLLNLQNDHRPGGRRFAGIVMTELDRATLAPIGPTRLLLQHERLLEGPKLVRRGDWFYLVLAEGGTGFEHGVRVARSRHVTGPYELDERPLLTSRDDPSVPLQKAGHGELVRTAGGDWVLSHLASRPVATPSGPRCTLGRETAVQAVVWDEDGWPRLRQGGHHPDVNVDINVDVNVSGNIDDVATADSGPYTHAHAYSGSGSGSGHAVNIDGHVDESDGSIDRRVYVDSTLEVDADRELTADIDATVHSGSSGGFDPRLVDHLEWPWSTLRAPVDSSWARVDQRTGAIRLRGRHGPESLWARSLLARRITEHRAEAEVTVDARPHTFTQAAGLVLYYNTVACLSLDLTWAEPEGEAQSGQQWAVGRPDGRGGRTVLRLVERTEDGPREVAVVGIGTDDAETGAAPVTLGVSVAGADARFWWLRDGVRTPIGGTLDFGRLSDDHGGRLRFTGAMVGIHAMDLVDAAFTAEFTGFRLACG